MPKKKTPHVVHYLNTYCEGDYSYKVYKEWCEDMDKEPAPEGSEAYWNWIAAMIENDTDDFFDNLKYSDYAKRPCVITGVLGLWHGHPGIAPERESNLAAAIKRCWGDCDAVVVTASKGHVSVEAMHHDGTNHFEIRPLTERGDELMRNGEDINPLSHWHTGKYPEYLF